MRDIVLISLNVPFCAGSLSAKLIETQIPAQVDRLLPAGSQLEPVRSIDSYVEPWRDNSTFPAASMSLDPVIQFGDQAVVVYHIVRPTPDNTPVPWSDQPLIIFVTQINSTISPSGACLERHQSHCSVGSGSPIAVTVPNGVSITSASPDWITSGTCDGCDSSRGQPGSPPAEPTPALTPGDLVFSPSIPNDGNRRVVDVLDTAYPQQSSSQHDPLTTSACSIVPTSGQPYTSMQCLGPSFPLNSVPAIAQARRSTTPDPGVPGYLSELAGAIQEYDQPLPTDYAYVSPTATPPASLPAGPSPQSYYDPPTDSIAVSDADHGLFVSSLINEIAPNADINLMRVLSDGNVGELSYLLRALSTIYYTPSLSHEGGLINLSLAVGPTNVCAADIFSLSPQHVSECSIPDQLEMTVQLFYPLQLALDALRMKDLGIVAAAGNFSPSDSRPNAPAIPALFCGVVSVASGTTGVLDTFSDPASASGQCYSSSTTSTTSSSIGYPHGIQIGTAMTVQAAGNEACGIYLQPIGDDTPSAENYLALWSGTSFAAAVASGYAADGNGLSGLLSFTQKCQ